MDKIWYRRLFDTANEGGGGGADPAAPAAPAKTEESGDPAAPAAPVKVTPAPDAWKDQRISELTFQKAQEKQLRDAADAENKRLKARLAAANLTEEVGDAAPESVTPRQQPTRQVNDEDIAKVADVLADSKAAKILFDKQCNDTFSRGTVAYKDFKESIDTLKQTGFTDNREALETAVNLPDPEDVMYFLGKNPIRAQQIAAMPAMARTVALVQISNDLKAAKNTGVVEAGSGVVPSDGRTVTLTGAPAPVRTLRGGTAAAGQVDLYDTKNVSMDDWVKKRDADVAARRAARAS